VRTRIGSAINGVGAEYTPGRCGKYKRRSPRSRIRGANRELVRVAEKEDVVGKAEGVGGIAHCRGNHIGRGSRPMPAHAEKLPIVRQLSVESAFSLSD